MKPLAADTRRFASSASLFHRVRRELRVRGPGTTTAAVVRALAARPGAELRETHGAWVVLSGDRAIKIKKPVRFSFMDFSTLAARRRACSDEVRLNRELAGDVYVGVRPVSAVPPYVPAVDPNGDLIDYAVEMRRFDERSTMRSVLDAGRLRETHVVDVAARLAAFHAAAPSAGPAFPQPCSWRIRAMADLHDLADLGVDVAALRTFAAAASARHGALMRARWTSGLVREGHGDLRADHVLLSTPVRVVDRLEFSRALRTTDVADDLAFLAMDLERVGARWAADLLLEAYAAAGGAAAPAPLAALFAWHRAIVAAKVAAIVGNAGALAAALALADRLAWRSRPPLALAVTGPPASGKSTLAARLGALLELPVVSSDVVRKQRLGIAPDERAPAGAYTDALKDETYRALADRARRLAAPSGGVIVDATFGAPGHRAELEATVGPVRWIACDAPPAVLAARAAARRGGASDAGPGVALTLGARHRPPRGALRLDTQAPEDRLLARVAGWLDAS